VAYVESARRRIAGELDRVLASGGPEAPVGDKAVERAAALLRAAGFVVDTTAKRQSGGVAVTMVATDRGGHEWLVDVVGGFTVARPGMRRVEVLERSLGRAARMSDFGAQRLLVMATDLPPRRSAGARALASARGRVMVDVLPVDAADPATAGQVAERLAAYAAARGREGSGRPGPPGGSGGSGRSGGGSGAGGGSGVPPPIGDLVVPG
jgi:hypothetical protein